ncbi:MAG: hypothetical protein ABJE95_24595 [Byssovorax sp.]
MKEDSFGLEADTYLMRLLRAAAEALQSEEHVLNKAFERGSAAFYGGVNQGLAYHLYETTLVYLIFKSWLPLTEVVWDAHKARGYGGAMDLVVFNEHKPRYAFEAKWWNYGKAEVLFEHDISKLRHFKSQQDARGFLITFWWASADKLDAYSRKVANVATQNGWQRIYQARFPIQVNDLEQPHFVLDAIEV